MFENIIRETPFLSVQAEQSMARIWGDPYQGDNSFLSTMRALLGTRISKDDGVRLRFSVARMPFGESDERKAREVLCNSLDVYVGMTHEIVICDLRGNAAEAEKTMGIAEKYMADRFKSFSCIPKCREYFRQSFLVNLYIDPENQASILFVDRLTVKKLHVIQIAIPVALPWYFKKEDGHNTFTPDERELINACSNPDVSFFEAATAKLAEQYDFRSAAIRRMLAGFETRYEKRRAVAIEEDLVSKNDEIERLNRKIAELLSSMDDQRIILLGLQNRLNAGISDEDSEIMQYCLQNTNVVLEEVNDRSFVFSCKSYADIFDEDTAQACIDNPYSDCYSRTRFDSDKTAMLLKAIFVDRLIKLRFCAAYQFNLNGDVRALSNHGFGSEFSTYLPNPHIQHYHCMGNYTQYINQFLRNRNYTGALEQTIASCASLNWNDVTVMKEFFSDLLDKCAGNKRCLELPDGTLVTAVGAVAWLEAQDEIDEQEEA